MKTIEKILRFALFMVLTFKSMDETLICGHLIYCGNVC